MKQVVLNVDERKYKFFMELVRNFEFVTIEKEDLAKKKMLKTIAEGMHASILASEEKIKSRSAKAFLNEL